MLFHAHCVTAKGLQTHSEMASARPEFVNRLGKIVRSRVEETLKALLDAEANRLCNASPYDSSEASEILGLVLICASFRQGPEKRRSCGIRPLKRQLLSATAGVKCLWRKPLWRAY